VKESSHFKIIFAETNEKLLKITGEHVEIS